MPHFLQAILLHQTYAAEIFIFGLLVIVVFITIYAGYGLPDNEVAYPYIQSKRTTDI